MANERQVPEGKFALIVKGEALPMDEISALVGLEPTRILHKGDLLNRLPEIIAVDDEWIHVLQLTTPLGPDTALNKLLAHLTARDEELARVAALGTVTLRMSVQSDYAQMTYSLMPQTLAKLAGIGLPLEISSISWGEIGI